MATGYRVYTVVYVGPKGQENREDATRLRSLLSLIERARGHLIRRASQTQISHSNVRRAHASFEGF